MPDVACQQKLKGSVVLVYEVTAEGRVKNPVVVESEPKGVFESTAINSVSQWIYEPQPHAYKIRQRIPMTYEDCRPEQLSNY